VALEREPRYARRIQLTPKAIEDNLVICGLCCAVTGPSGANGSA
jgi:hypothetical protein